MSVMHGRRGQRPIAVFQHTEAGAPPHVKGMVVTKLGPVLASALPVLFHLIRSDCEDVLFTPRI